MGDVALRMSMFLEIMAASSGAAICCVVLRLFR
jgi:hypothetical protein